MDDNRKNPSPARMTRRKALARLGLAAAVVYAAPVLMRLDSASASGAIAVATDPVAVRECSECHVPFSPRNLPATSWRKVFASLDDHFGEDASLGEATRVKVAGYYVANAGRPGNAGLKITETRWFTSEHRGEVSRAAIKKAGSMSNCTACHIVPQGKK